MDLTAELEDRVNRRAVHVLPQPQSAHRLRQLVGNPSHRTEEIVAAVMLDPMLAAAVMRIANSAAYARGGPTASLLTAVQRIGEKELHRLSLAAGLGSAAHVPGPLLEVRRRVMHSALTAATICERLASEFGINPEAAFLAGLLHDVGTLVALGTLELLVSQRHELEVREEDEWLFLAERHHVELGALLSERWQLPPDTRAAITQHHAPEDRREVLQLVRLSDALTQSLEHGGVLSPENPALSALPGERRSGAVAKLAHLPALIAALAGDDPLPSCLSLVAKDSVEAAGGPRFPITLSRGRAGQVVIVSTRQLRLEVKGHLVANQIEELEVATPTDALKLWVRVVTVSPGAAEFVCADAVPFAPSKDVFARLKDLSQHALSEPTPVAEAA